MELHKMHQCCICEHVSSSQSKNISHIRTHIHREPYRCMACGRRFLSPDKLSAHLDAQHAPDSEDVPIIDPALPFGCHLCSQRFSSGEMVVEHRLKVHDRLLKKFPCAICDEVFIVEYDLRSHMTLVHIKESPAKGEPEGDLLQPPTPKRSAKYQCQKCGKRFADQNVLDYHLIYH